MSFSIKDWRAKRPGGTPVNPLALEDMERRLSDYTDDQVATTTGVDTSADRVALARNPDALIVGAITRNANGAVTSGDVLWPDGTAGSFTGTPSAGFPGALDSYAITYGTRTYTQPTMTRDATGAVIDRPEIVVT